MSLDWSEFPRSHRRRFANLVDEILTRREELRNISKEELTSLAKSLKESNIASGKNPAILDDSWVVEPFALASLSAKLSLGYSLYECQILAGLVLATGALAEVKTGEGKTLIGTLPAAAFALYGRKVHVMTANAYLARRDSEWMSPIYSLLDLKTGFTDEHPSTWRKISAYESDIVYGTASQFGFDYLNDHLVSKLSLRAQQERHVALVDEADALLLDDARTPLIVSGSPKGSDSVAKMASFVANLDESQVDIDLEYKTAMLNDSGFDAAEEFFSSNDITSDPRLMADLYAALRARFCYRRDKEYLVQDNSVFIVDESTGRAQVDRRWQHGLHEAIEAKEGVLVKSPAPTLGSITIPNYLSMYEHIGAMTGTAVSDKEEFGDVYGLHVFSIPTNLPRIRVDEEDLLFLTESAKFEALTADVIARHLLGQPVLVGAPTVADAEKISLALNKANVSHNLLSAKDPSKESELIAQAGRLRAVTVATNMAGRGVDILLGGDPVKLAHNELSAKGLETEKSKDELGMALSSWKEICQKEKEAVLELGGLAVLGTARHSSRRVDDQLRGRSGRQGEPGVSQFYLSLDDDLLSLFAQDTARNLISRTAGSKDGAISHKMVSKIVASAQDKLESLHRDARRTTNEFSSAVSAQQHAVYGWRDSLLEKPAYDAVISVLKPAIKLALKNAAEGSDTSFLEDQDIIEALCFNTEYDNAEYENAEYDNAAYDQDLTNEDSFDDDLIEDLEKLDENEEPVESKDVNSPSPVVLDWVSKEVLSHCKDLKNDSNLTAVAVACLEGFISRNSFAKEADLPEMLRQLALARLDSCWYAHLELLDSAKDAANLRASAHLKPTTEFVREASYLFESFTQDVFIFLGQNVSLGRLTPTEQQDPQKDQVLA